MPNSPYENLPGRSFWRTAVSEKTPDTVDALWSRKFTIDAETKVATAGSCFAQHIARFLRQRGSEVIDVEPPPPGLPVETARSFGYLLYSARYGNIYSTRQLLQLTKEAYAGQPLADCVWEKNGRYYDAFRPSVEPQGLSTPELVIAHRRQHLEQVRSMLDSVSVFVFTMGLTEAWISRVTQHVYPTAPGTIAGSYDPNVFAFKNFTFEETYADFVEFRSILKKHNPSARILVTVSPVPLTATASDKHVLVATTYSKSVLRAVAGQLSDEFADVDYFPSYELIASPFSKAAYYEENLRAVREEGVRSVMRVFFDEAPARVDTAEGTGAAVPPRTRGQKPAVAVAAPGAAGAGDDSPETPEDRAARKARRRARRGEAPSGAAKGAPPQADKEEEVVCEEVLLEAFSR